MARHCINLCAGMIPREEIASKLRAKQPIGGDLSPRRCSVYYVSPRLPQRALWVSNDLVEGSCRSNERQLARF